MPHPIVNQSSFVASTRQPTGAIWTNFPPELFGPRAYSYGDSWAAFEDFKCVGGAAGVLAGRNMAFTSYIDSGGTLAGLAADTTKTAPADSFLPENGVVTFTTDTTDNDEISINGGSGTMRLTLGTRTFLAFEAAFCFRSTIATAGGLYLGLSAPGLAADNGMLADGATALAGVNAIGFRALEAAPTELDAVYNETSGTEQIVLEQAKVAVLDTYFKLGVFVDCMKRKVDYYVNGAISATATISTSNTTFPNGQVFTSQITSKNGTTTARVHDLDWVALGYRVL